MYQCTNIVVRFLFAMLPSILLLFSGPAHTHADDKESVTASSLQKTSEDAAEGDHGVARQLWHGNRTTPEQPFPARVVGVIPSWVGYALLLEEIAEKPQYCIAYLWKTQNLVYKIVAGIDAFKKIPNAATATYLTPGVEVDAFSWSIGVDTIGRRFGEQDLVREWYPHWLEKADGLKDAAIQTPASYAGDGAQPGSEPHRDPEAGSSDAETKSEKLDALAAYPSSPEFDVRSQT